MLEQHRDYLELKLRLKEQQKQHRDDLKLCLENKGSICAVGHDLKTNQNTTELPGSLQDETLESLPDCVQDQTPDICPESRPLQIVGHDLKTNQNTTEFPGSLRDETRESLLDSAVQDQTPKNSVHSKSTSRLSQKRQIYYCCLKNILSWTYRWLDTPSWKKSSRQT